jgi:acetyl-CoA carboxylase biotin carboxyl carrier protein
VTNKDEEPGDGGRPRGPNFLEPREIKRLIGILSAAGGLELELEDQGMRLRIRMPDPAGRTQVVQLPGGFGPYVAPAPIAGDGPAPAAPVAEAAGAAKPGTIYLKSPMVGTFYRAASPDAEPFVQVGDKVKADTTVCILEAMKVMNEIKAEHEGEVVQILVENGEPVEFGQPLLILKAPG